MIRQLFLLCLASTLFIGCHASPAVSLPAEAQTQTQEAHRESIPRLLSLQYTLGPLDVLEITLYEHPEFKREVTISRQGTFQYPLIGQVRARGLTVAELEKTLTQRLQRARIPQPHVAVTVKAYHNQHVFLLGRCSCQGCMHSPIASRSKTSFCRRKDSRRRRTIF